MIYLGVYRKEETKTGAGCFPSTRKGAELRIEFGLPIHVCSRVE
jgi:hypothetical protein